MISNKYKNMVVKDFYPLSGFIFQMTAIFVNTKSNSFLNNSRTLIELYFLHRSWSIFSNAGIKIFKKSGQLVTLSSSLKISTIEKCSTVVAWLELKSKKLIIKGIWIIEFNKIHSGTMKTVFKYLTKACTLFHKSNVSYWNMRSNMWILMNSSGNSQWDTL